MAREKLEVIDPRRSSIGVLFSGGLDSAALVCHYLGLGFEVWPIYVRSGLSWEPIEVDWAQRFLQSVACSKLRPLGFVTLNLEQAYNANWSRTGETPDARSDDSEVFLPARNLLLTTKAMLLLSSEGVHDIALATLKGNPFPDARPSYFRMLEKVLTAGFAHTIRIHTPYRKFSKAQIIRQHMSQPLHLSVSCINPFGNIHCGRCNKCAERRRAFKKARVRDLTVYADGIRTAESVAIR